MAQGIPGDDVEDLIPVDDVTCAVHHHQTVAVTVEGDAEIALHSWTLAASASGAGGTDTVIDVEPHPGCSRWR